MTKILMDMTFSYHQFKEILEEYRDEDGIARKVYVRGCKIHTIPFTTLEDMMKDLKIEGSLIRKCHLIGINAKQ